MGKSELIIAIAVCLLLSGGSLALALEEHEGAEGRVVEIKSQEDVDELMESVDFNGDSMYLLIMGATKNRVAMVAVEHGATQHANAIRNMHPRNLVARSELLDAPVRAMTAVTCV